jgi:hypothetical protein
VRALHSLSPSLLYRIAARPPPFWQLDTASQLGTAPAGGTRAG